MEREREESETDHHNDIFITPPRRLRTLRALRLLAPAVLASRRRFGCAAILQINATHNETTTHRPTREPAGRASV